MRRLRPPGLLAVILIIEPDTQDLVGVRHHRQIAKLALRIIRYHRFRQRGTEAERDGGEIALQLRRHRTEARAQVVDAVAQGHAIAVAASSLERNEPHEERSPFYDYAIFRL